MLRRVEHVQIELLRKQRSALHVDHQLHAAQWRRERADNQ